MTKRRGRGEGSRVYKRKDGTYAAFITVGYDDKGRQKKKWFYSKNREMVILERNKALANLGSTRHLLLTEQKLTVQAWLDQYIQFKSGEAKIKTNQAHNFYARKIQAALGGTRLSRLTPLHCTAFLSDLAKKELAPSTRQHVYNFFKAAMRQAVKLGLVTFNPLDAVDRPRGGNVRMSKAWERHEVTAFLEAAKTHRLYGAFYMMLIAGLRVGEVLALRWDDLDGERLRIDETLVTMPKYVTFNSPKTARGKRDIMLSEDAQAVLLERKDFYQIERDTTKRWHENNLIFCSAVGTPMDYHNFKRLFGQLLTKARVRTIRIHDLRHTYITLARSAGVDVEVVAERVGQDPKVTMMIYSKITEERKKKGALSLHELTTP